MSRAARRGAASRLALPAGLQVLLGVALVIFQPRLSRWVARRAVERGTPERDAAWWVWPAVLLTGVYGGYFGAAQGVLLMAVLGIGIDDSLQRLNGAKNPLAHLHQPDITVEKVMESPMLWDPIRFDETCPSSDGACAVVIGNEGNGLPEEVSAACDRRVTIPMHGTIESLNAAMAAGIILWEVQKAAAAGNGGQ